MANKDDDRGLIDEIVSAGIEVCGVLIVLMFDVSFAVAAALLIGACWLFLADDD